MPPVGSQFPDRERDATRTSNAPSDAADDFLAGEAVTLQRIGDELSLRIVQRQGPEPRRGRHAAHHDVAAPVERLLAVVGRCRERDAVAGADRQFAAARDRWRANRDRRRRCRFCGRAVQAPMVSVPRSVPRVAVIQVAPRPTAVAMTSASKVMRISRTVSSCAAAAPPDRPASPPQSCPGTRPRSTTPALPVWPDRWTRSCPRSSRHRRASSPRAPECPRRAW